MPKKPPKIIQAFNSLPKDPRCPEQEFKVSVVKYVNAELLLDIREYVNIPSLGPPTFSKRGVSLTLAQVLYIESILPLVKEAMRDEIKI